MIANTYLVPAAIQEAPYVVSYAFLCNPQTNTQWGSVSYYDNFQMRKLTYEETQKCYQNTKVVCNNMLHTRHIIIYINVFSYNNSNYNITALSINPMLCPIQHLMLQCFPETFSLVYNTLVLSSCGKAAKGSRGVPKTQIYLAQSQLSYPSADHEERAHSSPELLYPCPCTLESEGISGWSVPNPGFTKMESEAQPREDMRAQQEPELAPKASQWLCSLVAE